MRRAGIPAFPYLFSSQSSFTAYDVEKASPASRAWLRTAAALAGRYFAGYAALLGVGSAGVASLGWRRGGHKAGCTHSSQCGWVALIAALRRADVSLSLVRKGKINNKARIRHKTGQISVVGRRWCRRKNEYMARQELRQRRQRK